MTYQETLEFLNNQIPSFSKIGSTAIKEGLGNIISLCDFLDHPQRAYPSIHIAGTNGKGSTSHLMAGMLQACGYKVGLYTSPHLIDLRERFRINGQMISEESIINFIKNIKPIISKIKPSYFELNVAMAFQFFKEEQVDIAIIETGLGGRLDSTNIIAPILSIITNIGLDHTAILGNTLSQIATEKGGIIKEKTPILIGETQVETANIFRQIATSKNAPIDFADDHWKLQLILKTGLTQSLNALNLKTGKCHEITTDLLGNFQLKNIKTVLAARDILIQLDYSLPINPILDGFKEIKTKTGLKGRWETIHDQPAIIVDVGHNPAGITLAMDNLNELAKNIRGNVHIIMGFVKDKDIDLVLSLFPKQAIYYFTKANIPRALDEKELEAMAIKKNIRGESYTSVHLAIKQALNNAAKDDLILIIGSFFIVGEALVYLEDNHY